MVYINKAEGSGRNYCARSYFFWQQPSQGKIEKAFQLLIFVKYHNIALINVKTKTKSGSQVFILAI